MEHICFKILVISYALALIGCERFFVDEERLLISPDEALALVPIYEQPGNYVPVQAAPIPLDQNFNQEIRYNGLFIYLIRYAGILVVDTSIRIGGQNAQQFYRVSGAQELIEGGSLVGVRRHDQLVVFDMQAIDSISVVNVEVGFELLRQEPREVDFDNLIRQIDFREQYYLCPDTTLGYVAGWKLEVLSNPTCLL